MNLLNCRKCPGQMKLTPPRITDPYKHRYWVCMGCGHRERN